LGPSGSGGIAGAPTTSAPPGLMLQPVGGPETAGRVGGTELYGYLPYWEMSSSMATYLASVPLTTIELFSVSAHSNGRLDTKTLGYQRITGVIGARLIAEAHARGQRLELVFSSFGLDRNTRLFGSSNPTQMPRGPVGSFDHPDAVASDSTTPAAGRAATELAALAIRLGVDGVNLDVEQIPVASFDGYGAFVRELRRQLSSSGGTRVRLSAATTASEGGAALAAVAIASGVDRIFLMGYDYHWSGSDPGGSAPIDRLDSGASLRWSIALYHEAAVPANRIILGLPLFGMSWPTASSDRYAPSVGRGTVWTPTKHQRLLNGPGFVSHLDPLEVSEYLSERDVAATPAAGSPPSTSPGSSPGSTPGPSALPAASDPLNPPSALWRAIFYDSPRTLRAKLTLARAAGYAGAGFWAIGYEKGVSGYLPLMSDFVRGSIAPAPPPPAMHDPSDMSPCTLLCSPTSPMTAMGR
jgi:Glycosyl hydrolases family 18